MMPAELNRAVPDKYSPGIQARKPKALNVVVWCPAIDWYPILGRIFPPCT